MSLGSEIYSDSASFGRIYTMIGAVISTLVALALIAFGVYALASKNPYTAKTTGKILSVQLNKTNCATIQVGYQVNDKSYIRGFSCQPDASIVGESVVVMYDPSDPINAELQGSLSKNALGLICIAGGLLILFFSWLSVYLSRKYKLFAAAEGVGAVWRLFR